MAPRTLHPGVLAEVEQGPRQAQRTGALWLYDHSVEDIRLGPSDRTRRDNWLGLAIVTLLCVAFAVFIFLAQPHGTSTPGLRDWFEGDAVVWLIIMLVLVNESCATTLLTEDHVELRTLVTRRTIPWDRITGIEKKGRYTRTGVWYSVRVCLTAGRSVRVPGLTAGSKNTEALDRYLVTVRGYWAQATGGR